MTIACRGVRGAITCPTNSRADIIESTNALLNAVIDANGITIADVASIWFTTTTDLYAEFPAVAARQLGFTDTALMNSHEMTVPGALPMCIRLIMHWNTTKAQADVKHIYLRGATVLRPDLAK
ncbi:MAG: chorismate mutase [Chloroflexota bacterium]